MKRFSALDYLQAGFGEDERKTLALQKALMNSSPNHTVSLTSQLSFGKCLQAVEVRKTGATREAPTTKATIRQRTYLMDIESTGAERTKTFARNFLSSNNPCSQMWTNKTMKTLTTNYDWNFLHFYWYYCKNNRCKITIIKNMQRV